MEKSLQAQFLIPMAISLAFGVLFATIILPLINVASGQVYMHQPLVATALLAGFTVWFV